MTRATLIVVSLTFAVAAEAGAQNWASNVFKVRNHDFGNVARNAKAEFVFEIENPYATDLHICRRAGQLRLYDAQDSQERHHDL